RAIVSPLDLRSDQLSAAHMVQHMLLMTVAAPLVILGSPTFAMLWGVSPNTRSLISRRWLRTKLGNRITGSLRHPIVAWCVFAAAMWLWHLPGPYNAALSNLRIHDLQHISFFVAAC